MGMTAEEDGDEDQEDVPVLAQTADLPAARREDETAAGTADMEPAPVEAGEHRDSGQVAGGVGTEQPRRGPGEAAEAENGAAAETIWKEGPVWTVRDAGPEIDAARRRGLAKEIGGTEAALQAAEADAAQADGENRMTAETGMEWTVRAETAGLPFAGPRRTAQAQTGLEGLYRQTVQGLRPAAPALPTERAGRSTREQEPGSAASLAVDELDRAVRRDSRRYDGGLSIF